MNFDFNKIKLTINPVNEKDQFRITFLFSDCSRHEVYVKKGENYLEPLSESNAFLFYQIPENEMNELYKKVYS